MTQLAAWVGRDRALVGVDTRMTALGTASATGQHAQRVFAQAGGLIEGSKVLSLPHSRVLLANIGSGAFLGMLFQACQMQQPADDFDALDESLPVLIGRAFEALLEQRLAFYPDVPEAAIRGQLVLLVGWSQARGRVCASIFNQRPQAEGFQRTPLDGFADDEDPRGRRFAAPWNPQKSGVLPYASTLPEMERLARAQMRDFPASGAGGRLLVAELTRDSAAITSTCELESADRVFEGPWASP